MVYAADIIGDSFDKTKKLFFPIRTKYWVKMGLVSLFAGKSQGGYNGSGGNSGSKSSNPNMSFSEMISKFNTEALVFLSQYGFFVALGFIVLYLVSLFFSYISSVLTFVFIDGIVEKDLKIIKSFKNNNNLGISFFFLKFILGFFSLILSLVIFSPLIMAFFNNTLVFFNWWLLIPMFLFLLLFGIIMGLFWFLVYDFVIPIMYLKKWPFLPAWKYFIKIAKNQKMEIFLYWLIKIGIGMAVGLATLLILFVPMFLLMLLVIGFGVAIYLLINSIAGMTIAIIITFIIMFTIVIVLSLMSAVIFVPIPAFFTMYSLEMVRKLES